MMNGDLRPESGFKYASEEANEDGLTTSPRKQQRSATFWDIFSLGIVLTIGGIHITWNRVLGSGLAEIISAFVFISVGFACLILCSSEMTGLLPFSGGSYGFARVSWLNSAFFKVLRHSFVGDTRALRWISGRWLRCISLSRLRHSPYKSSW